MKYQPSANEKASRAPNPPSNQLPHLPPRINRSHSANDAAAAGVYGSSYMYGGAAGDNNPPAHDQRYTSYYGSSTQPQPPPPPPQQPPQPDPYNAYGYHQYAAEQAPTDEAAAYHQYHAQQAAMQHAQQQQHRTHLAPIYDNAAYNPQSYYNSNAPPAAPPRVHSHSHSQQQYPSSHYASANATTSATATRATTNKQRILDTDSKKKALRASAKPYDRTLYSAYEAANNSNRKERSKKVVKKDSLPASPTKLKHAATVSDMNSAHITYRTDLRYELEQRQTQKQLKRVELENKRKKLIGKNSLNMIGQKQIEETKKKWNLEREEIIKSFGGKIPSFIIESDKLRKDLENMSNRNSALQASLEVISSHLQTELYQLQYQLKMEKEISEQTHEHNIELERRVRELRIEKLELETELKTEKDKELYINNKEDGANNNNEQDNEDKNTKQDKETNDKDETQQDKFREYPPESTVIQNLLQAQVEFYFSDYNLKRDKRLLSDVVKPSKKGFLRLDEVMKLSRIRQLCSEIETLEEALRRSNILTLIRDKKKAEKEKEKKEEKDEKDKKDVAKEAEKKVILKDENYEIWVGRLNFEKPREKEFPFRRTVFIFGIPVDSCSEFLHSMLKPFGTVSKIQFDHSPDGIDRKIGIRFLNKPRVYTLYYYDPTKPQHHNAYHHHAHHQHHSIKIKVNGFNGSGILDDDDELLMSPNRQEMIFKTTYDINTDQVITNIKCHKCGKDKAVSEGFYTTSQWKVIYCAQCAAQLAEDQLNVYYKERNIPQYQHNPRHKWLGSPPNDIQKRKTALVVFASQRQASKCAYVRTRIAYKGAFATHFHHYSKVKKEIVLSESDQNNTTNNESNKKKEDSSNKNNSNKQQQNSYKQKKRQNNNNRGRSARGSRGRGRGTRGGSNTNSRYSNYAQEQAAYYSGQQAPQSAAQQQTGNKPKIYRQSSAPQPY